MPACSGGGFTPDEGSAASGGEPSSEAGGNRGGPEQGGVADAGSSAQAGSGGIGGEGGHPHDETSGGASGDESTGGERNGSEAGAPSGGTPPGGAGSGGIGGSGGSGGLPSLAVKAFDDFAASAEGWTVTGDDMTKTVTYSSTGGRTNGTISATETSTGVLFFTAPKKYLGDTSAYYGGELRFDLKTAASEGELFESADVEITSNLVTLAYDCTPNPTTSWKSYVVPLTEAGWKMTTVNGAAVSAEQFKAVLANLTRVRIRAEFTKAQDTGYLDNVYLGPKP